MAETPLRGRGTSANPTNRFELVHYEPDPEMPADDRPAPATVFLRDATRSIIASNDSPDVGFDVSINPYRGCEHGCVYCFARPFHEYLGMSAGLDFETRILVKENAPELLRRELMAPRWKPQTLGLSGVTDPYQPIERSLRLTRRCLEVLADFRNPVVVITKNHLITRDIDLLQELARHQAVLVCLSVTTLDAELARRLEPRASAPAGRLAAIRELSDAGVPVNVLMAPLIPGLNDHEISALLSAVKKAGARSAGYVLLRLPYAVSGLFQTWLEQHYPEKKDKVLARLRDMRDGRLYDSRFGQRMKGSGPLADMVDQVFKLAKRKEGLDDRPVLSAAAFRRPGETALALFGER